MHEQPTPQQQPPPLLAQGYGAAKVESESACFVRELDTTLEEKVEQLVRQGNYTITESASTTATPLDDDGHSDVGERVLEFCDDLPVYQMIFNDDEAAAALRDDSSSEDGDENSGSGSGGNESSTGSGNSSGSDESGSGSDEEDLALDPTVPALRDSREETGIEASPAHRQVSVTYKRCNIFAFFYCVTTTLTVTTGFTYFWVFG
ncbi:uncharacterized protein LOC126984492 isoform X2 [Eriocheir sinensis]|uniref:uncharacterized protein LOC126984492 isoform X2 n=1 Tax=Eriocheir sinensis TaxID=95602 RepID=UPI0021C99C51|nr:uncharacterized protein LOC126984492 isoform X2 [Eriocheir sinensis]